MTKLTDAVSALALGVNAQGEALAGALVRIQDDFTVLREKLSAAQADDAEAADAVTRINQSLARMEESTQVLANLDPDPENPVVPAPPPDPEPTPESEGDLEAGGEVGVNKKRPS